MEQTEGYGRRAQVWLGGVLLEVCDGVSTRDRRCAPGALEGVKFNYMTAEGFTWAQARLGNPSRRKQLVAQRGWSYVGYGVVVSIMPVVVDFGPLRMEDANWTNDESLVGKYVAVAIDRLEIHPDLEEPASDRTAEGGCAT